MIYGYARVSTKEQNTSTQIEMLYAAGCDAVYDEVGSGANDERPMLAWLMSVITTGDTIAVCKLDRIARSTSHLLQIVDTLTQRGATFKVLNLSLDTSTPTGKLMLTMLGAVATFEREIMLERQAEGIAAARAAGKYKGRRATAREQSERVLQLLTTRPPQEAAVECGIGIASVYRIMATARRAGWSSC